VNIHNNSLVINQENPVLICVASHHEPTCTIVHVQLYIVMYNDGSWQGKHSVAARSLSRTYRLVCSSGFRIGFKKYVWANYNYRCKSNEGLPVARDKLG